MLVHRISGGLPELGYDEKKHTGALNDLQAEVGLLRQKNKELFKELSLLKSNIEQKSSDKTLEESSVKSEQRFRDIQATIEEGYYEVDLKGKLVFFNESLCRILGYNRSELTKLNYQDYHKNPAEILDTYNRVYSTCVAEKAAGWTIITGEGLEKYIEVSVSLQQNDQGKASGFRGIVRDITERKRLEELLRESEERFRYIAEFSPLPLAIIDKKGNYEYINPSFTVVFGYTLNDIPTGRTWFESAYPDPAYRKQVIDTWDKDLEIFGREVVRPRTFKVTCKNGLEKEIHFRPVLMDNGKHLLTCEDISERKRYENQLKYLSLHDQLTGLYNRAYFENEIERIGAGRAYPVTIMSADLDGLKLVNDTIGHQQGDQLLITCANLLKNTLRESDVIARIGGDEFVVLLPQTDSKTAEEIIARIYDQADIYNLERQDQPPLSISIGLATAESKDKTLQETLKEADDFMYRDKLLKGVDVRSQIIMSLMATLGERDFITEGSTIRLKELCAKIGEKVGLSKKKLSDLALLTQVHNLGKVGIPDSILFKNGPLTEDQWQIIKQHPARGYRIALSSTDLSGVADLIFKHHESWDGSGYPLGIRGEDIPVECRILAIADAYEAMTNDRPYRKAMTHKKAVNELQKNAGTQFDPSLVNAFLTKL